MDILMPDITAVRRKLGVANITDKSLWFFLVCVFMTLQFLSSGKNITAFTTLVSLFS